MHVEDTSLLFIEACAGSALLSSVMRGAGFDVLAIDFGKVSRNSNIHVINLDLRQTHSWKFLHTVTLSRRVFTFMERHLAAQRRERGTKHYRNIIMDHNRSDLQGIHWDFLGCKI